MNERERIEREAVDLVHHFPERQDRDDLANAVINFVLRERAAAFESAAKACEALVVIAPPSVESTLLLGVRHVEPIIMPSAWIEPIQCATNIRAIAAQERAQAGEGGGRG